MNQKLIFCIAFLVIFCCDVSISSADQKELDDLIITEIKNGTFAFSTLDNNIIKIKQNENYNLTLDLKKWGDDAQLNIIIPYGKGQKDLKNNKLAYSTTDMDVEFYPINSTTENEYGGVEFDIILQKKPVSNIFTFPIHSQNLIFYYQPELTPDEIKTGNTRPDNVIGSYAVYHSSKLNNEYNTGKAFHIYRPEIFDSKGDTVWGELDIKDDILAITINQTWLDNAVYPIRIDPVFGYTSIGGTGDAVASDYILGSAFNGNVGTGTNITAYIASENNINTGKFALYKHSDSTKLINGETAELTNIPAVYAWRTLNFSIGPTLENTAYVIIFGFDAAASPDRTFIKYDTGASNQGHYEAITYPTFPAIATFGHTNRKYSIYCTYEESTPTPTPTSAISISPAHYDELDLPLILYILMISLLYLFIAFRHGVAAVELSLIYLIFAFFFLLFQTVTMSVNYIYLTLFLLLFIISIAGITKQGAD